MLTEQIANEVFYYDAPTGKLFWQNELPRQYYNSDKGHAVAQAMRAGCEACNVNKTTQYLQVVFQKKLYQVHRVIWLMVYGYWPDQIDHKDRNRQNNRLDNLREVSHAGNMLNRSDNSTGYPNIGYRCDKPKPWRVSIRAKKTDIPSKSFRTLDEAIQYRDTARSLRGLPPCHIR